MADGFAVCRAAPAFIRHEHSSAGHHSRLLRPDLRYGRKLERVRGGAGEVNPSLLHAALAKAAPRQFQLPQLVHAAFINNA
jgi:hypothetical protein